MILLPAIDLYGGRAVRLYKGDYSRMTVYDENPTRTARKFKEAGATYMHLVDLEGAKSGGTPNFETVCSLIRESGISAEVGGGIRTLETAERYLHAGAARIIFGTAAVTDPGLCREAAQAFGARVAVGADIHDGVVAIHGWTEKSAYGFEDFCERMQKAGIQTLICTDISRDGAMRGTNLALYRRLSTQYQMHIIASGGISTLDDIRSLRDMGIYGAILGKAYYTGAVALPEALRIAEEVRL